MKSTRLLLFSFALSMTLLQGALNASQLFVYPAKGQDAEQQDKDEYDCYKWAKTRSGVDPAAPASQPDRRARAAGTLGGGARGAAAGGAMGAIAGDAGKGAAIGAVGGALAGRRRRIMSERMEQDMTQNTYHRGFAACMEGRGYTVK